MESEPDKAQVRRPASALPNQTEVLSSGIKFDKSKAEERRPHQTIGLSSASN